MAPRETPLLSGGGGDRSWHLLSPLRYREKGDFVCLGPDTRWRPFLCFSGAVGRVTWETGPAQV